MSYQYGIFIYGIPFPYQINDFFSSGIFKENLSEEEREKLFDEWEKDDGDKPFGFEFLYSASGGSRDFGFLGTRLTDSNCCEEDLDSCTPFRPKDLLAKTPKPTADQKKQVQKMLNDLPLAICKMITIKPDIWII